MVNSQRAYYDRHKSDPLWVAKRRENFKQWSKQNPRLEEGREYRAKVRKEVFTHYGRVCSCCGEDRWEFLALDHKDGNGNVHRRQIGRKGGYAMCCWARKNNYPPIFRVLCHNCNMAIAFYGRCPHDDAR